MPNRILAEANRDLVPSCRAWHVTQLAVQSRVVTWCPGVNVVDILESPARFQSSEAPKLRAMALKCIHIRAANWEACMVHCTIERIVYLVRVHDWPSAIASISSYNAYTHTHAYRAVSVVDWSFRQVCGAVDNRFNSFATSSTMQSLFTRVSLLRVSS